MNRNEARDYVRGRIEEYLGRLGIENTKRPFRCLSPAHEDEHASMSLDRKHNRVKCFSCGATYDVIDLIKIHEPGIDSDAAAFAFAYDAFGVEIEGRGSGSGSGVERPGAAAKKKSEDSSLSANGSGKAGKASAAGHPRTAGGPGAALATGEAKEGGNMANGEAERQGETEGQAKTNGEIADFIAAARANKDERLYEYMASRGISRATVDAMGLGFAARYQGMDAVIIPTGTYSFVARNTDGNAPKERRYANAKGARINIFNGAAAGEPRPVFVAEGAIDALSLIEAGAAALALNSTANTDTFIKLLNDKKPPGGWEYPFILFMDNDKAGTNAGRKLKDALDKLGIPAVIPEYFLELMEEKEYQDANDWLVKDSEGFLTFTREAETEARGWREKQEAEKREKYADSHSAAVYVEPVKREIAGKVNEPYILTGFDRLDGHLGGGLIPGLYVVGSISSLGKTTFVSQIADNLARAGHDVIFFTLEMSRSEIMEKSWSRLTFEGPFRRACGNEKDEGTARREAKNLLEIDDGRRYANYSERERALIYEAQEEYKGFGRHLYIVEGTGDKTASIIYDNVKEHIENTNKRPIVIVDYLQIIAPDDPHSTDKQNTDRAVLALKRMSRDFKVPVIGVSSFNRENYNTVASMAAFKESGAIEYSSDVLIGLQVAGLEGALKDKAKSKDMNKFIEDIKKNPPRKINLRIIKNRKGVVGAVISYDYHTEFNYFYEKLEDYET